MNSTFRAARRRWPRTTALTLGLVATAACVESPGVADPASEVEPLAATFDAMSKASAQYGDLARSDGFAHAALAVRGGVTPSRLEVQTGTTSEVYDAFVSAVQWAPAVPASIRPPARRSLVGWRRGDNGKTRVFVLTSPSDSAQILSPLSLGPAASTAAVFAAGSAMQQEVGDSPQGYPDLSTAWYGTAGWVKLREVAVLGTCADSARQANALGMSRCEEARYLVRFDLTMQRLSGRPPQEVPGSAVRRVSSVGEPVVNGVRILFSCAAPKSDTGCK